MMWRIYDKTDTLLETIISDIDYFNENTITLSNNKIYNIIYCNKKAGIVYVDELILD